ncbi:MAG: hypothetical protein ACOYUZ_04230 [Patescibacteria group bacterium]
MSKLEKSLPWQLSFGAVSLLAGVAFVACKEMLPAWCYSAGVILIVAGFIGFISGIIIPVLIPDDKPQHWE